MLTLLLGPKKDSPRRFPIETISWAQVAFLGVGIDVGDGAAFVVAATNQGPANVYVQSLTWKGVAVAGTEIAYADITTAAARSSSPWACSRRASALPATPAVLDQERALVCARRTARTARRTDARPRCGAAS